MTKINSQWITGITRDDETKSFLRSLLCANLKQSINIRSNLEISTNKANNFGNKSNHINIYNTILNSFYHFLIQKKHIKKFLYNFRKLLNRLNVNKHVSWEYLEFLIKYHLANPFLKHVNYQNLEISISQHQLLSMTPIGDSDIRSYITTIINPGNHISSFLRAISNPIPIKTNPSFLDTLLLEG